MTPNQKRREQMETARLNLTFRPDRRYSPNWVDYWTAYYQRAAWAIRRAVLKEGRR